jgi:non-specific serine/threonine protein kinase
VDGDHEEPRYTMLETIREFGAEMLAARGEEATVRDRHARYFGRLAEDGSWHLKTSETSVWLPRLTAERDNLRAALEWLDRSGQAEAYLELASNLATYWDYQGQLNEGRLWIERALAKPGIGESTALANGLSWIGWFLLRQGDLDEAESSLLPTIPLWTGLGEFSGLAYALAGLGTVGLIRADFVLARERYDEALRLFISVGDVSGMAEARLLLSDVDYACGDLRGALAHAEAGLALAEGGQILTYTAVAEVSIAFARIAIGDLAEALTAVQRGSAVARSVGFAVCVADATVAAAGIAAASGQIELAVRLVGAAEASLRETGSARFLFYHQAERTRSQIRAAVGEQRYDRLIADGALFSSEAVTETVDALTIASKTARVAPLHLTAREREVLALLAAGKSDRDIAEALFITYRTANAYVARVLARLDVPSRTAAAARALREGLIE